MHLCIPVYKVCSLFEKNCGLNEGTFNAPMHTCILVWAFPGGTPPTYTERLTCHEALVPVTRSSMTVRPSTINLPVFPSRMKMTWRKIGDTSVSLYTR